MREVEQVRGKSVEPSDWGPLEKRIGSRCAEFMWMFREDGIEFYKHIGTRRYLLLDSASRCFRRKDGAFVEVDFELEYRLVTGEANASRRRHHRTEIRK